jgi:hypothetical protein
MPSLNANPETLDINFYLLCRHMVGGSPAYDVSPFGRIGYATQTTTERNRRS